MLRTAICSTLFIVILGAAAMRSFAWDDTGHKITAYIAWQQMTPDVRARVIKILLTAPEDAQLSTFYQSYGSRTEDSRKREFFMLAATWADVIRDRAFNVRFSKYAHGDWHYSDTFWTWKGGNAVLLPEAESSGQAMKKIAEFSQLIRGNAPDADKAVAIAWLEHLIGDMHQPLHASARVTDTNPKGDQGGNLFLLTPKGTPREKQENLHWFWDSIVVRYKPNSKDECEADFLDPLARDIMKSHPYDKVRDRLNSGNFDSWKDESYRIASTEVYKGVEWFQMPSDDYKKKAFKISEERLAMAGYRMADLFNSVFSTPAAPTPAPASAGK